MKKILKSNLILDSIPIIGVMNQVVNVNLEIVPQIEVFTLNRKKLLKDETAEGRDAIEFIIWLSSVRAAQLRSLTERLDLDDFMPEHDSMSEEWFVNHNDKLNNAFKEGFVSKFIVLDPGAIQTQSDDSSQFMSDIRFV